MKTLSVEKSLKGISYNGRKVSPGDIISLKYNEKEILIIYGLDRLWRDSKGTVYGFVDSLSSANSVIRCGIGVLSLPRDSILTDACAPHDYMYSCPAYQATNCRKDADELLKTYIKIVTKESWLKVATYPFYWVTRVFGRHFWENRDTR